MRTFEWLLWLANSSWVAWWFILRPPRRMQLGFAATSLLVAVLHLMLEGPRFHMLPTYGLMASLITLTVWRRVELGNGSKRSSTGVRAAAGLPLVAWVAMSAMLPSIFPVFTYDQPRGRFAIGTAVIELKNAPHNRDLVAQAWYPVAVDLKGTNAGITTHPAFLEAAYAAFTGLPKPLFDNLRLVKTHAISNAPMAPDTQRFPVVLFSHGPLGANRSQSIFQMEALASAGFVAIAIDHTGYASTTIFPDGHAVPPGAEAAWPVFVDERSTAMLHAWVADVRFALDRLEALNERDPNGLLTGRLDLTRVGYVGASFGGSVVVQALLDEPRIKAGVAEDGKPYFSDVTLTSLRRPLMYMQSAAPYIQSTDVQLAQWGLTTSTFRSAEQDHYARQMQLFSRTDGPIYNVYIRRTNHLTFSDLDLIIRLPDSQRMNIRRAHRIINDYTIGFFERYLNGVAEPLVDGSTPSPYQEVTVASRNVLGPGQVAENSTRP